MTDTEEPGKLTNGALKQHALDNLPRIPVDHVGPLPVAELADVVISWGGTGHRLKQRVFVAGYKEDFGISLGIVGESHLDPTTNTVDKVYFEWISHFAEYTPLKKY